MCSLTASRGKVEVGPYALAIAALATTTSMCRMLWDCSSSTAAAGSVSTAQSSLTTMRELPSATGRSLKFFDCVATLRTQAITVESGRARNDATRPLPIPSDCVSSLPFRSISRQTSAGSSHKISRPVRAVLWPMANGDGIVKAWHDFLCFLSFWGTECFL